MADRITETSVRSGDTVRTTRQIDSVDDAPVADRTEARTADRPSLAARIISFITGVILTLLALRFVLILLGANQGNGFVDFVYSVTLPLARPFFGIFGYDLEYGVARIEISTLVAMAVYGLIGYGLIKLITINRNR